MPFSSSENVSLESFWLNENVAGTYAPSSLGPTAPLREIIEVEESGRNYKWTLNDEHWKLARLELANGNKIPVESLAAYLLRDYAFTAENPGAFTVVEAFAEEFGYTVGGSAFSHLFETGDSEITKQSFVKNE